MGILGLGVFFYTEMPVAKPLRGQKVTVQLQDPGEDADFLLVGFARKISPPQINAIVRQIERRGKFKYARTYNIPVKAFGQEFSLTQFLLDMTYPFRIILLFHAR